MSETKIVPTPESPFADYLAFMSDFPEWVWPQMEWCAHYGIMHADTETFLLARPVNSSLPIADLVDFADLDIERYPDRELTNNHDAWHVVYASGGIETILGLTPYPLPKLIWHRNRDERTRTYDFDKLTSKINGKKTKSAKSTSPCDGCCQPH